MFCYSHAISKFWALLLVGLIFYLMQPFSKRKYTSFSVVSNKVSFFGMHLNITEICTMKENKIKRGKKKIQVADFIIPKWVCLMVVSRMEMADSI